MRNSNKVSVQYSRLLKILIIGSWTMAVISLHAQYPTLELEEAEGIVRGLNYESSVAVIDGYSYFVRADAPVEIRGTYGAFTMLEQGMKVSFSFYRISDSRREIVKLVQLSDNRKMDEN